MTKPEDIEKPEDNLKIAINTIGLVGGGDGWDKHR